MAHRFRDPAPSTPNSPAELGGHDHYHRFLRRLFGPQVRSASRSQGHLDRTTASAGLCCRANSLRSNQPNLCGMMWVEEALARHGKPEIFNTDQGSQFTSTAFTGQLIDNAIAISMDGRGAWRDNVFVERLWRSVKYEEIYLKAYDTVAEARNSLAAYFGFYNSRRPHSSLDPQASPHFLLRFTWRVLRQEGFTCVYRLRS